MDFPYNKTVSLVSFQDFSRSSSMRQLWAKELNNYLKENLNKYVLDQHT